MRLHICGKGNLFMVEVISGPNVLWQLYRPPGITRAFRQKGHTGHWEHKTLGHFMCPQTKRLGCYLLSTRRKDFLFVHHPILREGNIFKIVQRFYWKLTCKFVQLAKMKHGLKCCRDCLLLWSGLSLSYDPPHVFRIFKCSIKLNSFLFFKVFSSVQWRWGLFKGMAYHLCPEYSTFCGRNVKKKNFRPFLHCSSEVLTICTAWGILL